jgi:DNA topoisomerase-1
MASRPLNHTPQRAARSAGLTYVSDTDPGIRRGKAGRGFAYREANGAVIRDARTLRRIRSLAIPPAWTDVWICSSSFGHIQATGRDDRGRKQYKYHPQWREVRDQTKYERMLEFARLLPRLRAQVAADMSKTGTSREKVLASVVSLLDKTLVRVGNDEYARTNDSYGLATLRTRHLDVAGSELRFQFEGKSGKAWKLRLKDRRIARVLRSIQDLPGQRLFQYVDGEGDVRSVDSSGVNDYLREITGQEVTTKDFRTWAGAVLAVMALSAIGPFSNEVQAKSNVRRAIEAVATRLGNTPAVCRKCYVHPEIVACYMEGALPVVHAEGNGSLRGPGRSGLPSEERTVLNILRQRLRKAPGRKQGLARRSKVHVHQSA